MDGSDSNLSIRAITSIAEILHVPPSFFLDDQAPDPAIDTPDEQRGEVLRLFAMLPDDNHRRQMIAFVRVFTRLATVRASRSTTLGL